MNQENGTSKIWAYALIALGALLLAANMGWFGAVSNWLWALLFMAGGAAFVYHYLNNRERWWALIPGGVLATLAVVNWVELANPRYDAGWLFFLGIAATFGYLYRRPDGGERQPWAVWPAVVGLGMALLGFVNTPLGGLVAPLALIGLGVYLFTRRGKPEEPQPPQAGSQP